MGAGFDGVDRAGGRDPVLAPDCSRCLGLCCVALPFSRGAEFPEDKPAGRPCRHLSKDFRCAVHDRLAATGWRGCVRYECFGAGQLVSQVTYAGRGWREGPEVAEEMFSVLAVVRALHEIRFLVSDPACAASSYAADAAALDAELAALTRAPAEVLLDVDLASVRARAGALFAGVSGERARRSHRGADLLGADLRGADLSDVDLLGADLRGADIRAADLSHALFVSQPQLNGTWGDAGTRIPHRLSRPALWELPGG